mmetsp:Transcript_12901/g.12533  ORF Transcript_12901/g.12533 Transcript_12901/m.12533 type:complete len:219 (-) Transcript_12901:285-941(-)
MTRTYSSKSIFPDPSKSIKSNSLSVKGLLCSPTLPMNSSLSIFPDLSTSICSNCLFNLCKCHCCKSRAFAASCACAVTKIISFLPNRPPLSGALIGCLLSICLCRSALLLLPFFFKSINSFLRSSAALAGFKFILDLFISPLLFKTPAVSCALEPVLSLPAVFMEFSLSPFLEIVLFFGGFLLLELGEVISMLVDRRCEPPPESLEAVCNPPPPFFFR